MTGERPPAPARGLFAGGLWRHGDFLRLWSAQTVSGFGARISRDGLAMTAVASLGAGPADTGRLAAIAAAPALVVGLFAGGLVDRTSRRAVLITADLGRVGALLVVPIAALAHRLAMIEIYFAAMLVGGLGNLFDMADHAYLPSLVDRDQLMEANAKLSGTDAVGEFVGPALAGSLFQALTAPFALLVNALTYLASAGLLATIRRREAAPQREVKEPPLWAALRGVRVAMAQPLVRPVLLWASTSTFFGGFFAALYVFYALKTLGLTMLMMGLTIAVGGIGSLIGAAMAGRVGERLGVGPALIITALAAGVFNLFVPLASGAPTGAMIFLMIAQLFADAAGTAAFIYANTIRQSVLPPEMLGRVAGAFIAAGGLMIIAGALIGGELGQVMGPRPALYIACAGLMAAPLLCLFSPLVRLRRLADVAR